MSSDTLELMDLPEPILLHVMSYLGHDFLRHVAPKVSMEWQRLAHSQVLWLRATLSICILDCWDESPVKDFVRNILVTPYLRHLTVIMNAGEESTASTILAALLSSNCRLHRLSLSVSDYGPEIMLFLQEHPELKELQLGDNTAELRDLELSDNAPPEVYTAGVAATIRRLAPHLDYLNLTTSGLLQLPKTGPLLASPPTQHEGGDASLYPADMANYIPAGSEPAEPVGALDLRGVDVEDCEVALQAQPAQPQGLLHLNYSPYGVTLPIEPSSIWAAAVTNMCALLRTHKHSLRRVNVNLPHQDVLLALAECAKLEELVVACDATGEGLIAMVQAMVAARRPGLRLLHLEIPASMGAQGLATVLAALGGLAPSLRSLSLAFWGPPESPSSALFPGFKPLQTLLTDGQDLSLSLSNIGPVGRAEFMELAAMASTATAPLGLRTLHVSDCACSAGRTWAECRDRAEDALRAALPALEYTADCVAGFDDRYDVGFMPMYSCDCERRRPARGGRRRSHPRED